MQTSDQLPEKQSWQEQLPREELSASDAASLQSSASAGEEAAVNGQERRQAAATTELAANEDYDEEAVLKGLIYPPPPSFYVKQRSRPPARPASAPSLPSPPPAVPSPPYPPQGYPVQGAYPAPVPYAPGMSPYASSPRRQSYAWVWVLVGLIVALVLTACGLFAWLSYSMFGASAVSANDAARDGPPVVNNYYRALQSKDYAQAYSYLSPSGSIAGLTQAQFTERARASDEQYGSVYTFQTGDPVIKFQGNQEVTNFTITVDIKRGNGKTYTVHLALRKVGTQWKIADFDQI